MVTSTASEANFASRTEAWISAFRSSSFSSIAARTELASCPMTGRSSAVSLPICLRTAVSSPFLPSSLTRSSSRAAGVDASSRAAIAWERMLSSCCFMFFPPKNEKTLRSRTGTKGNASAVPPAFSPLKTARFRTQSCPRWITASPVRPYSRVHSGGGSREKAQRCTQAASTIPLSLCAQNQRKAARSLLFHIFPIVTQSCVICKHFFSFS